MLRRTNYCDGGAHAERGLVGDVPRHVLPLRQLDAEIEEAVCKAAVLEVLAALYQTLCVTAPSTGREHADIVTHHRYCITQDDCKYVPGGRPGGGGTQDRMRHVNMDPFESCNDANSVRETAAQPRHASTAVTENVPSRLFRKGILGCPSLAVAAMQRGVRTGLGQ